MKYRATEHALVKPLDEGAMALNLESGDYYSLNETAARMWALMERGCSQAEIVAIVAADYQVSTEQVESDLAGLLRELLDRKLIVEEQS